MTKLATQVGPEMGNQRFGNMFGKRLGQRYRGYDGMTAMNCVFPPENLEKFPTDRAA